jgi:hypothetical protein
MDDAARCRLVEELESELTRVDGRAPVVPAGLATAIEARPSEYVDTAARLTARPTQT